MDYDPTEPDDFARQYAGITRVPELADHSELWRVIIRHTPEKLRRARTSARVLLSVSVSETGKVLSARAVVPHNSDNIVVRGIMTAEDGSYLGEMSAATTQDPDIIAAAEAACYELSFRPAERDGTFVPFPDYRLSIEFPGWYQLSPQN